MNKLLTVAFIAFHFGVTGSLLAQTQPSSLSLATAQSLLPQHVTATGRVQAVMTAGISSRVGGFLAEFGKDDTGRTLDVGMRVKKGHVLFRLDQTTMLNAVATAEAAKKVATATLENLKAPPREEKVTQLREAIGEIDSRLEDKGKEESRYRRLVEEEKTMPVRRLEEVQSAMSVLRTLKHAAEARLREAENGPTATEIAVAQAQVQQAETALKTAQDDLRDATVTAPFDGLIIQRLKSVGDFIPSGSEKGILELVSIDQLEIDIKLPEAYFSAVKAGKTIVVVKSGLMKEEIKLPVTRVVASIDASKGTFCVRVAVPANPMNVLVPGAFVNADVDLDGSRQGVVIPQRAVQQQDGKNYVYLAQDGKMLRTAVELGDKLTEHIVITAGVNAGQKVLYGPADLLKDGTAVPEGVR